MAKLRTRTTVCTATVVGAALVAGVCFALPGSSASNHAFPPAPRPVAAILDSGSLVVTPASAPATGLTTAIAAFRSTTLPQTQVSDVVAGYGNATAAARTASGRALGTLDGAWVITYRSRGPLFCPAGLAAHQNWPDTAFIYWHGIGVSYRGTGAWCGPSQAASAAYASKFVSIPWQTGSSSRGTTAIRYDLPSCATSSAVNASVGGGRVLTVTVSAVEAMDGRACQSGMARTATIHNGLQALAHATTGLVPGIFTTPQGGFSYSTTAP